MVTKKKLTKEEWKAMTGTDMSLILPSDGSIETAKESSLNDTGKEKSEGTVEQTDFTSENLQPSTGKEEAVPTSQRRISYRQRKLSLDEYRKTFLQVPKIEDRKPVFVSGEVRDRLDEFVRRLTKLQFWELARLSFGHPENLAPLPKSGGNPLSVVADCEKKNNQKSNKENMNDRKKNRPRGRPRVSGVCKLSKAVTVKFSKIDYERLCRRSRQANLTLAEFLRVSAFETTITARHSAEETAAIRSLTGMANNLNQLTRLSHQAGFHRTQRTVTELLLKLKEIIVRYRYGERRPS